MKIPRRQRRKFYHRTSAKAAASIRTIGFEDTTTPLCGLELTGVWLSNIPLDTNEGAKSNDVLLQVVLDLPARELERWEITEDGKPYREWCIPAKHVNRGSVSIVSA